MSRFRQAPPPEEAILVRSLSLGLPPGTALDSHRHTWGQLIYATRGVMTVNTEVGAWVVPPHRAAWVPAGVEHALRTTGAVRLRTVYVRPDLGERLSPTCGVLSVTALLRELVLEVVRRGMLREDVEADARLAGVLIDFAHETPQAPLELPWPRDPRAQRVARAARDHLADTSTLAELARGSGASARTLERLFTRETGLSFGRWRQQARLLGALEHLASGESVTQTALAVGFASTSAFITMFRRALDATPGSYFRAGHELPA